MVLRVPAPSTFVSGVIVARNKSTTLIVSRKNILYKFSILILGKHLYLKADFQSVLKAVHKGETHMNDDGSVTRVLLPAGLQNSPSGRQNLGNRMPHHSCVLG